jgi:hypothetical protein
MLLYLLCIAINEETFIEKMRQIKKKNAVRGSHYTALNGRIISVYWSGRKL